MDPFASNLLRALSGQFTPEPEPPTPIGSSIGPPGRFFNPDPIAEVPPTMYPDAPGVAPRTRLEDIYRPETEMTNRYNQMVMNPPERNKPGTLRKIGATIAAIGGNPEDVERTLYSPYMREMADYQSRMKDLHQAAGIEAGNNQNARAVAASMLTYDTAQARNDIQAERNRITEENNRNRTAIAQKRAEIADFKARNPNFIAKEADDGMIYMINPRPNAAGQIEVVPTGLRSGDLTEAEKLQTQFMNRMQIIDAQSQAALSRAMTLAGVNFDYSKRLDDYRTANDKSLKTTPSGDSSAESANQQKIALYNKAQQAFNSNPAWAKWLTLGEPSTNTFQLTTPGKGASNQDWTDYKDAYRYIYGVEPNFDQTPGGASNAGKPVATAPAPIAAKKKVTRVFEGKTQTRVKNIATGQTGWYPDVSDAELKAKGYERIYE